MDMVAYIKVVDDAFDKLEELQRRREALDAEAMKLEQLIAATANMLPDNAKEIALKLLDARRELSRTRELGLTDATRLALKAKPSQWLTVSAVRDLLLAYGFDFSSYTTNPLASVSAVLKRMKNEEVEITTVDGGVAAYRWKQTEPDEHGKINWSKVMKAVKTEMAKK